MIQKGALELSALFGLSKIERLHSDLQLVGQSKEYATIAAAHKGIAP